MKESRNPRWLRLVVLHAAMGVVMHAFGTIDRQELVSRHNPVNREVNVDASLTVGNGGFAFGLDITGLQTFPVHYHRTGIPTETLSRWCWHTEPNTVGHQLSDTFAAFTEADGRINHCPTRASTAAGDWLRKNPHDVALGQVGFAYTMADGRELAPSDILNPEQTLDLWRGAVRSRFEIENTPVEVVTACHPEQDLISVEVVSPLIANGSLKVRIAFPRCHILAIKNSPPLEWEQPDAHETVITSQEADSANLVRTLDDTRYHVSVAWSGGIEFEKTAPHCFHLKPIGAKASDSAKKVTFQVAFSPEAQGTTLPGHEETLAASARSWERFWTDSAAVDFSESTDPRADRIEERIILSRYLMRTQMVGSTPPQESGLTCSTWYGKHHTEMIWWHTAHFALWGNDDLLAKNLEWYRARLPEARMLARSRGLRGARWPKMVGPDARESPGGNPLIVWNQPHMVHLCELLYRNHPMSETLQIYGDLVLETAECLASMLHFDEAKGEFVLGPPLWIAQEIYDQSTSQNPGFELAYWKWALSTAQNWRERIGLEPNAEWDRIIAHLAPLPEKDGKYVAIGSHPDTWDNVASRHDHPTMLAPLGVLPGEDVDRETMGRTLDAVLNQWDWETKIWGWDYPMIAMTAARLGQPETAVEILMREGPNNIYLPNGHCPQRSDEARAGHGKPGARKHEIAAYLPANGAFLSAVALMIAGWDDGPKVDAPGFPKDGTWTIKYEGLHRMP